MRTISVFDGMACGMLAMQAAGIPVDRYVAFEIDKYAIQTSSHNFPMIEHRGDVFQADFTEFSGFDFLVGGSPCTYWSIAQKNNRETEASGMGWELFCQYVRALHEAKPRWFIYENNKSMSKAIRESITQTFGFEPICINSALVSAQNRQRLYWVGKRNPDGTYSKVHVEQPEDRGILLRDVLDGAVAWQDKGFAYTTRCQGASIKDTLERHRHTMVAEPVASTVLNVNPSGKGINGAVGRIDAKSRCLTTNKGEGQKIIVPVRVGEIGNGGQGNRIYSVDGKSVSQTATSGCIGSNTGLYAVPVHPGIGELTHTCDYDVTPQGTLRVAYTDKSESQGYRVYSTEHKSVCLRYANGRGTELIADTIPGLAIPCEWDDEGKPTKAISGADGKTYPVYQVKDGQITIKGKSYPIKLEDGFYIIRKLTVSECKRLQTVPEWYEFPVSDTQAFKMLGNGWTVLIISHIIQATQADELEEPEEQISLFK